MHEQQVITVYKALADRTRLDIVRQLWYAKQGTPCSKVRECSSLSQPAMSHHLGKLVDAGVVLEQRQGKEKYYELDANLLSACGIDVSKL